MRNERIYSHLFNLCRKRLNELAQGLGPHQPDLESSQGFIDGKNVGGFSNHLAPVVQRADNFI